jgi:hypothetical protein
MKISKSPTSKEILPINFKPFNKNSILSMQCNSKKKKKNIEKNINKSIIII